MPPNKLVHPGTIIYYCCGADISTPPTPISTSIYFLTKTKPGGNDKFSEKISFNTDLIIIITKYKNAMEGLPLLT
jgi:hypothetical protein